MSKPMMWEYPLRRPDFNAVGWMFSPKGTVPLAPRSESLTLPSDLISISIGSAIRQSTSCLPRIVFLPFIARSLNCDLRILPGTVWVLTRPTA